MGQYSTADRRALARTGAALPPKQSGASPRFPINNAKDLQNAKRAVGRATPKTAGEHNKVRRHIIRRARALGLSSMIPDNWASDGSLL